VPRWDVCTVLAVALVPTPMADAAATVAHGAATPVVARVDVAVTVGLMDLTATGMVTVVHHAAGGRQEEHHPEEQGHEKGTLTHGDTPAYDGPGRNSEPVHSLGRQAYVLPRLHTGGLGLR